MTVDVTTIVGVTATVGFTTTVGVMPIVGLGTTVGILVAVGRGVAVGSSIAVGVGRGACVGLGCGVGLGSGCDVGLGLGLGTTVAEATVVGVTVPSMCAAKVFVVVCENAATQRKSSTMSNKATQAFTVEVFFITLFRSLTNTLLDLGERKVLCVLVA